MSSQKNAPRFGPSVSEFKIVVPVDYQHDNQIEHFCNAAKKVEGAQPYIHPKLTEGFFEKEVNKLIKGETYRAKIVPLLMRSTTSECLRFLETQNSFLVGAQGLLLVRQLLPEVFPVGSWVASFPSMDILSESVQKEFVIPFVYRITPDAFAINLAQPSFMWLAQRRCLLCVDTK